MGRLMSTSGARKRERGTQMNEQAKLERVFAYPFGDIYGNYVAKVERKGHTRNELDDVLGWFTQMESEEIHDAAESGKTLREFFSDLSLTPHAELITGKVCGVRVEEVEDELMRRIRMMDLLVDELARGKEIENIKRG